MTAPTPSTELCPIRHPSCKSRLARRTPDETREADQRAAERRLRDLRGRVKAARAAISTTPGAEEVLRRDWVKAARFYAKFGITATQFWIGVPADMEESGEGRLDPVRTPFDWREGVQARAGATLSE